MTRGVKGGAERGGGRVGTVVRFWCMLAILAWTVIYRLSEDAARLPEFVYVNF
jgi:hypothetical protein